MNSLSSKNIFDVTCGGFREFSRAMELFMINVVKNSAHMKSRGPVNDIPKSSW